MGKSKAELHAFDLLQIRVTDDASAVEAAIKKLTPKMLHLKNHGTADERRQAEDFFKATTPLKVAEKRRQLIDEVFARARNVLNAVLSERVGSQLKPDTYQHMLRVLTDEYNFEAPLAERRLRDYCKGLRIQVGKVVSDPFERTRLVENLRAKPQANGVALTWHLPDTDCDGVRVIRNQTGPPKSPTEGREIASGRIASWTDTTAEPGRKYTYAVFSVLGGKTSTRSVYCEGYCLPDGVESLRPTFSPPAKVELKWKSPAGCRQVWLFRSGSATPLIAVRGERLVPPPDCVQLGGFSSKSCGDEGLELGREYYYHAVADFGGGMFSEKVTACIRLPKRPRAPAAKRVISQRDRVVVEWTSADPAARTFRLYRRTEAGALDLRREEPVYEGPDTRYEDKDVEAGKSYWYYVVAAADGLDSPPTRLGPALAVDEVRGLTAVAGEGQVVLKWRSPLSVVRYIVRRGMRSAPSSNADGDPVLGATGAGVVDRSVTPGAWYAYRVACVFRDANGREITTPGVTTEPSRPFRMPNPPRNFRPSLKDRLVHFRWDAASGSKHVLICRATFNPDWIGRPVSLAELERGGRHVPQETGGGACDPLDESMPWYLLATLVDANTAAVNHAVFGGRVRAKAARRGDEVVVSWQWPDGIQRMRITRRLSSSRGGERPGPFTTTVERLPAVSEGAYIDVFDPVQAGSHERQYELSPVADADRRILVLPVGPARVTANIGTSALLWYSILHKKKRRWGLGPERPFLQLSLDRRVDALPALRLLVRGGGDRDDRGTVVLRLPRRAGPLGPSEHEVEIQRPASRAALYARLDFEDPADAGGPVKIVHPPADKARL